MKKKMCILIVAINIFLFSGCWNYKEINGFRLVLGAAIDYDIENQKYILTTEIINPAGKEGELSSEIFQTQGETLFDAMRDLIMKTGRRLYWAHAKSIIISEEIAKQGMIPVLDMIFRDAEMRTNMGLVISGEETAQKIYQSDMDKLHKIYSAHIEDILDSEEDTSRFHGVNVWRFSKDLYAEGLSPTLPIVKLVNQEEKMISTLGGNAVFNGDRMVGTLDEIETKFYLMIIDKLKGGILLVSPTLEEESVNVALEILSSKTKIEPIYADGEITMNIDIETNVNIGEIGGDEDFISKEGSGILVDHSEKFVEKEVEALIKKVQKKYHSDVFGFSTSIKRKMPKVWKVLKLDWEEAFTHMDVKVKAKVNIRGTALLNKPLKISK